MMTRLRNETPARQARRGLPAVSGLLLAAALLMGAKVGAEEVEGKSPPSVPGAQTITTAEAYTLHQAGVSFVDVRNPRLYARRHIPGAHHLDLSGDYTQSALTALVAADQPVVIYCSGRKCNRSSIAAGFAVDWGFTQVKYFRDGIVGWRDAGYPLIESSP